MKKERKGINFKDDAHAFNLIKYTHHITRGGVIYPIDPEHIETDGQRQAINYLCAEWDWAWATEKPEEIPGV